MTRPHTQGDISTTSGYLTTTGDYKKISKKFFEVPESESNIIKFKKKKA